MSKVKYFVKENKSIGTHSYYAVSVPNGTLTFDELCEEACLHTSIEPSLMRAAVTEYINTVKRNVLKGFRAPVGDQFLTVYPSLTMSVKDEKDDSGNVVKAAKPSMVNAAYGKSRLGATVHTKFSNEFAANVSWQKIDAMTGALIEDEDITQNDPTDGGNNGSGDGPAEERP